MFIVMRIERDRYEVYSFDAIGMFASQADAEAAAEAAPRHPDEGKGLDLRFVYRVQGPVPVESVAAPAPVVDWYSS